LGVYAAMVYGGLD